MRKLFPALLLGLASRPALAAAPPTVPASLDVAGLHLTLDDEARQLVQAKVNSLCRHPASFEARVALAEAAFPLIDQVLAEEGVPADFRYLVLQESALQGNAESAHGAVGYWQLKRETALSLGLTVNGSIDERRHLTASTRAAARYLTRNNATLHNWANALLSYNTGLGGVRPYTQPADADATDMAFTADTNQYLLDFLAQKIAFEPVCAQHAVPFVPWREVPAAPGQTLAEQAAALTTDPDALAQLNPWLLARAVPQDGHAYTLLVPLAGAPPVAASPAPAHTSTLPAAALPAPTYLRINGIKAMLARPGETAAALAQRGGASLGFFLKVNELDHDEPLAPGEPYFFQRKKEAAEEDYHVLAPGQSLAAVAQHYGVLRHALRTFNHLPNDEAIRPGLVLWLSHSRPRNIAAEYQPVPGTRPVATARPVPLPASTPAPVVVASPAPDDNDELASINDLPTEVPGPPVQPLPVPHPAVVVASPAAPSRPALLAPVAVRPVAAPTARPMADFSHPYLVAPGETLYALARRVGVRPAELAAWNAISPATPLRAGQLLHLSPPAAEPALPSEYGLPGVYTVASGDTFYSISRRYNCTVAELLAHNERATLALRVGETLRVPRQ
ncbi:LysM peptidoglycan-binding domain-containing protein [Hymenobacter sp. BRD128]|uniref:LysM peptidoglycan-binding domain-containing protein n=1 Tax=Hymenobacter sp. BRD128 TaxID=2675878 RepID=UPI001564D952|nr:LysM peptidoglycan-binding domain-containing protein [Hymenobacter sp. BRD128]QKG56204.1 LysM peptidoglycan-binding domain-containing protein [Hymenobacter sp. BRD128]